MIVSLDEGKALDKIHQPVMIQALDELGRDVLVRSGY